MLQPLNDLIITSNGLKLDIFLFSWHMSKLTTYYVRLETTFQNKRQLVFRRNKETKEAEDIIKWLDEKRIMRIQLPGNSSDLNPLENLWVIIKRILNFLSEFIETVEKDCSDQGGYRMQECTRFCWIINYVINKNYSIDYQ